MIESKNEEFKSIEKIYKRFFLSNILWILLGIFFLIINTYFLLFGDDSLIILNLVSSYLWIFLLIMNSLQIRRLFKQYGELVYLQGKVDQIKELRINMERRNND
jgi:hypothetical protein